jgi:hypothetical protein
MTNEQEIRVKALEIAAASLPSTTRVVFEQRIEDLKKYAGLIERYIFEAGQDQKKP